MGWEHYTTLCDRKGHECRTFGHAPTHNSIVMPACRAAWKTCVSCAHKAHTQPSTRNRASTPYYRVHGRLFQHASRAVRGNLGHIKPWKVGADVEHVAQRSCCHALEAVAHPVVCTLHVPVEGGGGL